MIDLLVAADDRTGALEAAGGCADAGTGPVWVGTTVGDATGPVAVLDLATRHAPPAEAAERATAVDGAAHRRAAHKIDSLLRGNWATELVARHRASGRRVLVVPALPAADRACVAGVVRQSGEPLGTDDPRSDVASNRPADHLRQAGAAAVAELAGAEALARWRAGHEEAPFAVCDATTDDDLAAVAAIWDGHDGVLFAGTAAGVAAAARAMVTNASAALPAPTPWPLPVPVLVVCGSLHPMARRQVAHLGAQGVAVAESGSFLGSVADALAGGRPAVVVSRPRREGPVSAPEAQAVAEQLAATAGELAATAAVGTLVVLGGDTAAAVLGPAPLLVGGTLAAGTPWGRRPGGAGPLVVTRAGSFGTRSSLAELVWGRLGR